MALIDKVEIVFQSNGKRRKVLLSWLLSQSAHWAFDANPFIVQDNKRQTKSKNILFCPKGKNAFYQRMKPCPIA